MTDGPVDDDPTPAGEDARTDTDAGSDADTDRNSEPDSGNGPDSSSGFGRGLDSEPVAVKEVLVPVDGSDESIAAMEYATAIAERYDARVHVLYVLDETVTREMAAGTVEESEVAARGERFMDVARERAPEDVSLTFSTAYGFSPTQKSRHPGSVIVDAADAAAVDFLVIPRESGSAGQDETLSSAAEYVLQYADQPVLST